MLIKLVTYFMSTIRNSKFARAISGFVGLSTALVMVGGAAVMPASALTIAELQAQILALQAQLTSLQGGSTASCAYTFATNLKQGSTGTDVMNLQKVLNMNAATQVSSSGAGSPGNETSYFGPATKAAVIKFQNMYASDILTPVGLTAGTGFVGASTRAKLNGICTSTTTTTTTTPTAGTGLTVAAATQPANSLAPQSTARIPFTKVTFTAGNDGDVTVSGITVERGGLAQDAVFSGIVLMDENDTQWGIAKTLNSNHQATVGDSFVVKKGTSRTMTIAGNMASSLSSYAGQIVSLSVVGVNTSATVTGSLPISGAQHTINSTLSTGSVTMARGSDDPGSSQTKEIGTTGYTFSSVKVTAGSAEKVYLKSIRWNQTGSAGSGDLANLKTYVDGTAYDMTASSDGKYYTTVFSGNGILIDKGFTKDASVRGDITGGSGRTVDFDIAKRTDVGLKGETYGYGIIPPQTGSSVPTADTSAYSSSEDPWYDASQVTVSAGTITVSTDSSVAAQNIAINLSNQPLGGYSVEVRGEPVTVSSIKFNLSTTTSITNVSLVDGTGKVLAGPLDTAGTAAAALAFTDAVTFPVGTTKVQLKGKLSTSWYNNATVAASTTPSTDWTSSTGQTTGNSITLSPTSALTSNTMTVKSGALTVNVSTQPVAQNVVAGASQFTFANYIFDASQSGEDVRITSIPLYNDGTGTATDLTSCQLYDGATSVTTGSNIKNPTAFASTTSMTFDGSGLTISKGTSKTLALKCNVKSGTTSTYWWGIDAGQNSSFTGATGLSSGQTIAETFTDANGQVMTAVAGGSYTVVADSSASYNYKAAQAGTNVTLGALRFTANASEDITLKQIALELGNTASNSPSDLVGQKATLWDGSTKVGEAQFGLASADNATSTLTTTVVIPKGETKTIVVKGDLSAHDTVNGTPGAFLSVTYDGDNNGLNGNYATGNDSGSTISGGTTSDVTTNGVRIFRTVPTVAVTSNGGTGTLQAGADLFKFTVTNPNSRDVVFYKFTFSTATSGANVNGFTLYGDSVAFNSEVTLTTTAQDLELTGTGTSQAQVVPANGSKTYVLKASSVANPSTSVIDSITLALLADTSYPSLAGLMGTVTTVDAGSVNTDNIIWSPFSTTTPEATAATQNNLDWTNGYGLPGFPSNAAFPTQTWTSAN